MLHEILAYSLYHIAGKFGEFGKLSVIGQTITINLVLTIDNLLADILNRQIIFAKCSKRVNSPNFLPAKLSRYTVVSKSLAVAICMC